MKLYIRKDYISKEDKSLKTDDLVREVLVQYRREEGSSPKSMPSILRTESGKPFFDGGDVHFSVSHSGSIWACLMGKQPVGLDIQEKKPARWKNIAERFFTEAERDFVARKGEDAFWRIWVAKEAYVKYLGTTLAEGLGKYSIVEEGRPANEINGTSLQWIEIEREMYGACAMRSREEICIRRLK